MGVSDSVLFSLVSRIEVMKPASVKGVNPKQLGKLEMLLDSPDYVAEDKIDGCHYIQVAARFFSTDHVEKTDNYPHMRDFFEKLKMPNLILDGEMNYPGKTSQYCTQVTGALPITARMFQDKNGYIHYTIWDMLRTPKGTWLINEPLAKRRELLVYFYNNYIATTPMGAFIHLTQWIKDDKRSFRDRIIQSGGEGVVLKNVNSLYVMGKKPAWQWVKIKIEDTVDLFISGYEPPSMDYTGTDFDTWPYWRTINGVHRPVSKYYYLDWIGAIELSAYVGGQQQKICTCSGISESLREAITLDKESYLNRVVKVKFMQRTEAGYPRHPRFEEFHESKTAAECLWEFEEE